MFAKSVSLSHVASERICSFSLSSASVFIDILECQEPVDRDRVGDGGEGEEEEKKEEEGGREAVVVVVKKEKKKKRKKPSHCFCEWTVLEHSFRD